MIYTSVLSAVVSALAAECIDNTSKQAWQRLYRADNDDDGVGMPSRPSGEIMDRTQVDCWVFGRLHSQLKPRHWYALAAKYSTHKGRKVEAIGKLCPMIATPAPKLFLHKAVTAWAIPKLMGARPEITASVSVDIPTGASPTKREAIIKAALAADKVKRKRMAARSADMIVLPDSFYDMNTWDLDGRPESTRREWRRNIAKVLAGMTSDALKEAEQILDAEGVLLCEAA